ncbi:vWA domain-containing protein [Bdellovibrionota bacterium FG-2]
MLAGADFSAADLDPSLEAMRAWDIATRYHEFKNTPSLKNLSGGLRRIAAHAILARAREILGSVVHPEEQRTELLSDLGAHADRAEIDVEMTLEDSPEIAGKGIPSSDKIWMTYPVHRPQSVILCVDTSLSMTGEKLALTAVAVAVVLLQFPEDPIGVVAFENDAQILKRPEERITIEQLVERFLDVPAQGYTYLEEGMKCALGLIRGSASRTARRPPSTVLLSDGKYTAGRDPAYLASRFPHLIVLKMGKERASYELCRELAQKGKGSLKEVPHLESLPEVMYGVVKDLLRGRSL